MPDDEWGIAVVVQFDLGRKFAGSFLLSEIDKRRLIAQLGFLLAVLVGLLNGCTACFDDLSLCDSLDLTILLYDLVQMSR